MIAFTRFAPDSSNLAPGADATPAPLALPPAGFQVSFSPTVNLFSAMNAKLTIAPPPLREGDIVTIVAPAGLFDPEKLEKGVEILQSRGLRVRRRDDVLSRSRYLAGGDERRLEELQEAFDDPESRAVWAIRGGYGSMRLLAELDISLMLSNPKWFVGFSDVTAIHSVLNDAGLVTLHAPMVAGLEAAPAPVLERLWSTLFQPISTEPFRFEPSEVIRDGSCRGPLIGGNMSLVTRLLGTPFQPSFDGAILFLEEVGEAPYRLDRMLTHLELAGVPERLSGVLLGELTGCDTEGADYRGLEVAAEKIRKWGAPAVAGVPTGHGETNHPILLGATARLVCESGTLAFEVPGKRS